MPASDGVTCLIWSAQSLGWRVPWRRTNLSSEVYVKSPTVSRWKSRNRSHETYLVDKCIQLVLRSPRCKRNNEREEAYHSVTDGFNDAMQINRMANLCGNIFGSRLFLQNPQLVHVGNWLTNFLSYVEGCNVRLKKCITCFLMVLSLSDAMRM